MFYGFKIGTKVFLNGCNGIVVENEAMFKFQRDVCVRWDTGVTSTYDKDWLAASVEFIEQFRLLPGMPCTVNGMGDLMFCREDGRLIGKECVIVKRCKSGLIQVALRDDPKYMRSIPQKNVDLMIGSWRDYT